MQSNSRTTDLCACVGLLLALHSIPVVGGILAVVHIPGAAQDTPVWEGIPVVDTLEAASAALQIRMVAARALLLVVVRGGLLPMVAPEVLVPGCS